MAVTLNEATVPAQPDGPGVTRQRLVSGDVQKAAGILLDRVTLAPGATMPFKTSTQSIAWLQLLDGEAKLSALYSDQLSNRHSVFLPPDFNITLSAPNGASLLHAELSDVGRFDPEFAGDPPLFLVSDWMREPVFECERDGRKRVFLVGPHTCGTKAMLVEMVVYPPGTQSARSHHEGSATLVFILSGRGMAWGNEGTFSARPGDVIYFADREQHYLKSAGSEDMRFLEFFIPGEFKTVTDDTSAISKWVSTGRDIRGGETAVDEKQRRMYKKMFGNPFIR
jgi:quercetin dioxygenase-like cupin family protein